jgi:hypothetical protein
MLTSYEQRTYANIISDGTIRIKCDESDPKAVKRDYELKDGTKGTKIERVYNELSGIITALAFYEGDYGKILQVTVSDNEEEIVLCMNVSTNFAEDLMKKLPNINLDNIVIFKPYAFEDDKKKLKKGISIIQNGQKIKSYFHDTNNQPINGYPGFTKEIKEYDSDDWKIYFLGTRKFLQQYIESNIIPKLQYTPAEETTDTAMPDVTTEAPFEDSPTKNVDSVKIKEQMLLEINELALIKLNVTVPEEIPSKVMSATGLAFVEANLPSIIEQLKKLPNVF